MRIAPHVFTAVAALAVTILAGRVYQPVAHADEAPELTAKQIAALEAQAFASAHAGFYDNGGGRPRLAVREGRLDLRSLHTPGFASAAAPLWRSLKAID